jgi:hypothetical protein
MLVAVLLGPGPARAAETLVLQIQPDVGPVARSGLAHRLAAYLAARVQVRVEARVAANVLAHWRVVAGAQRPALVLDEAHFVDARVARGEHRVVARLPGLVGHSVVTAPGTLLLDADELEGRTLAAPPAPTLGTVRLLGLYPDLARRPLLREARTAEGAVAMLLAARADAALVPGSALSAFPDLNVLMDAEPVPAPGLTVSVALPEALVEAIRMGLLQAPATRDGRALLRALEIEGFEPATQATYEGYASLLRGTWGYEDVLVRESGARGRRVEVSEGGL